MSSNMGLYARCLKLAVDIYFLHWWKYIQFWWFSCYNTCIVVFLRPYALLRIQNSKSRAKRYRSFCELQPYNSVNWPIRVLVWYHLSALIGCHDDACTSLTLASDWLLVVGAFAQAAENKQIPTEVLLAWISWRKAFV